MIIDVDRSYVHTGEDGNGVKLVFEEARERLVVDLMNDDRPDNEKVFIFLEFFDTIAYEEFKSLTETLISEEEFHEYATDDDMGYEDAKEYFDDPEDSALEGSDTKDTVRTDELEEGRSGGAGRTGQTELTKPDDRQSGREKRNKRGRQGKRQGRGR